MEFVLLFPGQGSQKVGMGKDLHDGFPAARDAFQCVDDAVGASLSSLAFNGPSDELTRTFNAQPALLAHSAAAWAIVRECIGSRVVAAAGHSLGEFSAYHAAGALELSDAARIVRRRGSLMYEQGVQRPGAMAAILGTMHPGIDEICATVTSGGALVVPANYNSPEQVVISGAVEGVERAMQLAKDAGAKRCLPLPVSGAFHSPLMAPAAEGLTSVLAAARWRDPTIPVFANVDGSVVQGAAAAQRLLVEQLTAPVQWTRIMHNLATAFPHAMYVEVGTGSVLSGLARRVAPGLQTMTCGTVAEVEQLIRM